MADEAGWQDVDGRKCLYLIGGMVRVRLVFPPCFNLRPGLTAYDVARARGLPRLGPGKVWRFMTTAEMVAYEIERAEADAA